MADYIIYAIGGISLGGFALMLVYCKLRDRNAFTYDD